MDTLTFTGKDPDIDIVENNPIKKKCSLGSFHKLRNNKLGHFNL